MGCLDLEKLAKVYVHGLVVSVLIDMSIFFCTGLYHYESIGATE